MYKTLYRKWRPKIFQDVVGQDHVTDILKKEVISQRISHAYLFTGSRGTGKTSCAKILAKAINCESPVDGNPCGECDTCKKIENEQSLDIIEIDAASNNKVENIRDMREEVVFTPANCKYRVYIVDEVHMLSTGAFNAFLKTLEEPPPHVVFILATTELSKLPLTITSRCQKFRFYRLSENDICKRIKYVCDKENIKIEDSAAKLIADSSDGALRDALSFLDQCFNVCQNNISEAEVKKILGISEIELISSFVQMIITSRSFDCLGYIDQIHKQFGNIEKLCESVMMYFRKIMIYKVSSDIKYLPENFDARYLEKISLSDVLCCLDILQNSFKNMSAYKNQKLQMEVTALKLCDKFSNRYELRIEENTASPIKNLPSPEIPSEKSENNLFEILIKKAKLSNIEVIYN